MKYPVNKIRSFLFDSVKEIIKSDYDNSTIYSKCLEVSQNIQTMFLPGIKDTLSKEEVQVLLQKQQQKYSYTPVGSNRIENRDKAEILTEYNKLADQVQDPQLKTNILNTIFNAEHFDEKQDQVVNVNIIDYSKLPDLPDEIQELIADLKANKNVFLRGHKNKSLLPTPPSNNIFSDEEENV